MKPDWILSKVAALKGACEHSAYRLRIEGVNLNSAPGTYGYHFTWVVHDVADPRYDLANAEVEDAAKPFLNPHVDHIKRPALTHEMKP
jgi:hypothetical protein